MELKDHIIKELQTKGRAEVPAFGVFYLLKTSAEWTQSGVQMLPPGFEVGFSENPLLESSDFIKSYAQASALSEKQVLLNTENAVHYWKNSLLNGQDVELEGIGKFTSDENNKYIFQGERLQNADPNFFGLEEVHLPKDFKSFQGSEALFQNILWLFLVVIPVVGLGYLGYTQRYRFMGGEGLDDLKVTQATHRIPEKTKTIQDSVQLPHKKDSLRNVRTK